MIDAMVGFNVQGVPGVRKATDLESLALAAFALLTGLATAFLIWQALRRQLAIERSPAQTLRALGLTEHQIVAVAAASGACIGILGAALALVSAVALSPLVPIGVSRRVETQPGVHVDPLLLGSGAMGLVAVVLLASALAGWRSAAAGRPRSSSSLSEAARPSPVAGALEAAAVPVSTATGVRMALVRGRGPEAVPVATLLVGAAVGLAGVTAVLTFGASLTRLVDSPARYGVTWDAAVGNYADAANAERGRQLLDANPDVIAYAGDRSRRRGRWAHDVGGLAVSGEGLGAGGDHRRS
jgi:putative ABC transport system permease protein